MIIFGCGANSLSISASRKISSRLSPFFPAIDFFFRTNLAANSCPVVNSRTRLTTAN